MESTTTLEIDKRNAYDDITMFLIFYFLRHMAAKKFRRWQLQGKYRHEKQQKLTFMHKKKIISGLQLNKEQGMANSKTYNV